MNIHKDIQQRKFASSRHKALINILFTYGWAIERIKKILSIHDITHQQFNILRILRGSYPMPLSTLQIRERMLDKMSDTSRIVDRLILKDLAQKTTSVKDHRLVDVVITEKGQTVLREIDEGPDLVLDVMSNISEEEAEQLSSILDNIRHKNLNTELTGKAVKSSTADQF
jgi:MarR family 2-MHQ and catechol resistance regulon transcriptional repressor